MAGGDNVLAEPRRREKKARGTFVADIMSTDENDEKKQEKKKDESGGGGKKKRKKRNKKSGAGHGSDDGGHNSSGGEHSFGASKFEAGSHTSGDRSGMRSRGAMQEDVMAQVIYATENAKMMKLTLMLFVPMRRV